MYLDYPRDIPVNTPLGTVFLAVTSGEHVHVDGNSNGKYITVNGVDVTCSLSLNLVNGAWQSSHLYSTRRDNSKDSSPAARKKIVAVIIPVVTEFLAKNTDLLHKGQRHLIENKRDSLQTKIADLEGQLAAAKADLAKLENEEAGEPPFVG